MFDRAIVHIRLSLMIIYFQRAANYAGALMEKWGERFSSLAGKALLFMSGVVS